MSHWAWLGLGLGLGLGFGFGFGFGLGLGFALTWPLSAQSEVVMATWICSALAASPAASAWQSCASCAKTSAETCLG